MNLSNRDLESLQKALLELHEPRDLDGLRRAVPGIIRRVVPNDFFLWLESGTGGLTSMDHDAHFWQAPVRMTASIFQKTLALVDDHPFTRHVLSTGHPGPLRLSDFWTRRQQLASTIHRQVYRPLDIGHLLVVVTSRGHRGGTLNLARSLRRRDFSERDRRMLGLFAPHFLQALQAAEGASARRTAEHEALRRLGLTPRQRDVAVWLARGRTNPEIATILAAKPRTVEKHVEKILFKLGVENRTAAAHVILGASVDGDGARPPAPARARHALRGVLPPGAKGRGR